MDWTLVASTVLTASLLTVAFVIYSLSTSHNPKALRRFIVSPRDSLLPNISSERAAALPYPPDLFPGARDVVTPYGTMRVFEWGPEDGKKVVFIHGDSTPSPVFGPIANALARRGCRVMIFGMSLKIAEEISKFSHRADPSHYCTDLWGRGYSDTPLDVPHSSRLFGLQILFATASSAISWNRPNHFSLVGFSLGGGIAMSFAAHFPYLVDSIVLLAPGGILRYLPPGYDNTLLRIPHLLPSFYLRKLAASLLGVGLLATPLDSSSPNAQDLKRLGSADKLSTIDKNALDSATILQWQFDHHKGFVHSFINTIIHGPLMNQQPDWQKTCNIIKGDKHLTIPSDHSSKLFNSKLLTIFGDADGIVAQKDVVEDLTKMIGTPGHLICRVVPGGHGFPLPSSDIIITHLADFWGLEKQKQ